MPRAQSPGSLLPFSFEAPAAFSPERWLILRLAEFVAQALFFLVNRPSVVSF
jgi:hypothetical protein